MFWTLAPVRALEMGDVVWFGFVFEMGGMSGGLAGWIILF